MPSVAQIDGLNIPGGVDLGINPDAATSGFLFTYSGAQASYSVRQLNNNAPYVMRVRRDTGTGNTGNDDEADVKFDTTLTDPAISLDSPVNNFSAGGSNATTLGQFLNVGTVGGTTYTDADSLSNTAEAFVAAWYDLTGNQNHAEQTGPDNQPQIHNGTVSTDLIQENGKPGVKFDFSTPSNIKNLVMGTAVSAVTMSIVIKLDNNGISNSYLWSNSATISTGSGFHAGGTGVSRTGYGVQIVTPTAEAIQSTLEDLNQHLVTYHDGSTDTLYADSSSIVSGTLANTPSVQRLGERGYSGSYLALRGKIQELILWDTSTQQSNRTGIEDNINSEYLIYQPTDQPTSGLLYDYGSATGGTDAAAAYSVRQLSDKAVLCMRIRRDMGAGNPGDDDEINIGFDANGDLDTQAISDFCGTGTGFVTRWWDQSVNGNHADQPVGGTGSNTSQPQIYNGTAVITENAKPALKLDGTNDYLEFPATMDTDFYYSVFAVRQSSGTDDTLLGSQDTNRYWADFGGDGQSQSTIQDGFNGGSSASTDWTIYRKNGAAAFTTTTTRDQYHTAFYDGNQILMSFLTDAPSLNSAFTSLSIGAYANLSLYFGGTVQEFIMYQSTTGNQSSNATGIETDIDTYYQIPGM